MSWRSSASSNLSFSLSDLSPLNFLMLTCCIFLPCCCVFCFFLACCQIGFATKTAKRGTIFKSLHLIIKKKAKNYISIFLEIPKSNHLIFSSDDPLCGVFRAAALAHCFIFVHCLCLLYGGSFLLVLPVYWRDGHIVLPTRGSPVYCCNPLYPAVLLTQPFPNPPSTAPHAS